MAIVEGIVLNGLDLNPASGNFVTEAVDLTPPKKKLEWAQNADADGADLIRTPLYENRTIGATVRVTPQASMNEALVALGSSRHVVGAFLFHRTAVVGRKRIERLQASAGEPDGQGLRDKALLEERYAGNVTPTSKLSIKRATHKERGRWVVLATS